MAKDHLERVAYHEAAHVVVSHWFGAGPCGHGIDLGAATSVQGAFGNASVGSFLYDQTQPESERRKDLAKNVAMILAGPICDAKLQNIPVPEAIAAQPGDRQNAWETINQSPLLKGSSEEERNLVFEVSCQLAISVLQTAKCWSRIEKVAAACLANDGKISANAIAIILDQDN